MRIKTYIPCFFLVSFLLICSLDSVIAETSSADAAYPGEVRETKDGKKVKLWSTKGPVPVSRPNDPFADPNKNTLANSPNTLLNIGGVNSHNLGGYQPNQRNRDRRDGSSLK